MLSAQRQRDLARSCLHEGPIDPNTTSLDPHFFLPKKKGLWQTRLDDPSAEIRAKPPIHIEQPGPRQRVDLQAITLDNLDKERADERARDLAQAVPRLNHINPPSISIKEALSRLRWANIGYAYHVRVPHQYSPIV